MKKILACFLLTTAFSSYGSDALISQKLAGTYELIKTNGKGAQLYCVETLEINVTEAGVFTNAFSANFYSKDSGCQNSVGDIGPLRTKCNQFSKRKVSLSSTEPLTIVGFVREYKSISLDALNENTLTYVHNTTEIPFGILGIGSEQDFSCKYQRVN